MKLAIGTAQFGLDYGVTNQTGAVVLEEITKILDYARNNDILTLDTAAAYGNSEQKLGDSGVNLSAFQFITKIPPKISSEELEARFFQSLNNLKLKKIHGLLVHNANDILLDESNNIWKLLKKLKEQKLVDKIGVSVYSEEEIKQVLERYEVDIIQLPINVFDQRLLKSGILEKIKNREIEIHARSLFLQGILLSKPESLPAYFVPYNDHITKWHDFVKNNSLTLLEGALGFTYSLNVIDFAVVGITSLNNLIEIKTAFDKVRSLSMIDYTEFACNDEQLINPPLWKI